MVCSSRCDAGPCSVLVVLVRDMGFIINRAIACRQVATSWFDFTDVFVCCVSALFDASPWFVVRRLSVSSCFIVSVNNVGCGGYIVIMIMFFWFSLICARCGVVSMFTNAMCRIVFSKCAVPICSVLLRFVNFDVMVVRTIFVNSCPCFAKFRGHGAL